MCDFNNVKGNVDGACIDLDMLGGKFPNQEPMFHNGKTEHVRQTYIVVLK